MLLPVEEARTELPLSCPWVANTAEGSVGMSLSEAPWAAEWAGEAPSAQGGRTLCFAAVDTSLMSKHCYIEKCFSV